VGSVNSGLLCPRSKGLGREKVGGEAGGKGGDRSGFEDRGLSGDLPEDRLIPLGEDDSDLEGGVGRPFKGGCAAVNGGIPACQTLPSFSLLQRGAIVAVANRRAPGSGRGYLAIPVTGGETRPPPIDKGLAGGPGRVFCWSLLLFWTREEDDGAGFLGVVACFPGEGIITSFGGESGGARGTEGWDSESWCCCCFRFLEALRDLKRWASQAGQRRTTQLGAGRLKKCQRPKARRINRETTAASVMARPSEGEPESESSVTSGW